MSGPYAQFDMFVPSKLKVPLLHHWDCLAWPVPVARRLYSWMEWFLLFFLLFVYLALLDALRIGPQGEDFPVIYRTVNGEVEK